MPTAAVTGFVVQFWDEIKSKIGTGGKEDIQELSPDAYSAASAVGRERGDERGHNIDKTAQELKYRELQGQPFEYRDMVATTNPKGRVYKVSEFTGQEGKVQHAVLEMMPSGKLKIELTEYGDIKVTTPQGNRVSFNKRSANIISKIIKLAFRYDVQPNSFNQY